MTFRCNAVSTNFQLCFAFSLAMISQGYNILKTWSLYLFAIFVVVPFFHFWWECLAFSFSFFSFFHFDRQCLATIFSQVTANKIRKRPGAYIQRFRYGSGEKEVFSRSGWLEGWGVGISSIGPDRNQMWKCLPIFNMEIWFFGTQNTFYLIVRGLENVYFLFTPLLLGYPTIFDRAAASRKEELGILVVGRKWLFSCVKSISEHM